MYNVCIVDDNRAELKVIADSVQKYDKCTLNIAAVFSNGKDAYDYIVNNSVDIVITDIQMPKMTGMDLIRKLREDNINIQAIAVSCYDEFKYAQQAIDLEIIAYVLKPVSEAELHKALTKAVNKAEKKTAFDMEDDREVVLAHRIKNMLLDERDTHQLSDFAELPKGFEIRVADCKIDELAVCNKNIFDILDSVAGFIDNLGNDYIKFYPVKITRNELALIIVYKDEEELRECIDSIVRSIDDEFGFSIKIGISEKYNGEKLSKLYRKSLSAVEETVLCRNMPVLFYEDIADLKKTFGDIPKPVDIQKELRIVLKHEDSHAMTEFLDKYIGSDVHYTMGYIKNFAFCVINSVEIIMNENCTSFDDVFENHIVWDKLDKLEDVESIYNFLVNILGGALNIIDEEKKDRNYAIVENIKKIIAQGYHKRLTVASIAGEVGFSAKHTQRMFMKATGSTILDYLTLYRMERAKENLENGGKISVTAELVGYRNKAHFSNVFKEYTGLSPAEYKMKHMKL